MNKAVEKILRQGQKFEGLPSFYTATNHLKKLLFGVLCNLSSMKDFIGDFVRIKAAQDPLKETGPGYSLQNKPLNFRKKKQQKVKMSRNATKLTSFFYQS